MRIIIFLAISVCCLCASLISRSLYGDDFNAVSEVLDNQCLSCHDKETSSGGIDLTPLLDPKNGSYGDYTRLWIKVEGMVAKGEMPPKDEALLSPAEKKTVINWFHQSFVLRNGKPHIGPTPLRRLTRYELQNTLEDVLAIKLRSPYRDTIAGKLDVSRIESIVPSDIPGESGFDNDSNRMARLKPPLKEISAAMSFALGEFVKNPAALETVFGQSKIPSKVDETEIKKLISRFVISVYRGNHSGLQERTGILFDRFERHFKGSNSVEKSLLHIFQIILLSPEFLYRAEQSKDLDVPYPVTGSELATRLSYFLWSAPPDEELLKLGASGKLCDDNVLKAQVARMLNSPKRLSLSENFAGQWLGFEELLTNREYFQDERWNRETYDEVLYFFDELIRSDHSLLELVQSEWIYKRASELDSRTQSYERLTRDTSKDVYADILGSRKTKSGNKPTRYDPPVLVRPKNDREGGLITSAAIMRLTASKSRTSPIRRGVWVLSTVIGKDLEPPQNVPSLEESRKALNLKRNPTVVELIQQHVGRPECISCHKRIDPLGLGLENYSPFGKWRTHYPDRARVESAGVMPNGKSFQSPREMKQLLLEIYKEEIASNFLEKMFAYALGRKVEPYDRVALRKMLSQIKSEGYKVNTVIEQIVLSKQFRYRQDN